MARGSGSHSHTGPKFMSPFQKEWAKTEVSRMYVQRYTLAEIGVVLGISASAVSLWVKKILKEWQEERLNNVDARKREEIERVNEMEREMWEMWRASKGKKKKVESYDIGGKMTAVRTPGSTAPTYSKSPQGFREGGKIVESDGNMEYWHAIEWCVDRRIKLLGLDAAIKVAHTDPSGTREFGEGARELLLQKLDEMGRNREEADRRREEKEMEERRLRELVSGRKRLDGQVGAAEMIREDETGAIIIDAEYSEVVPVREGEDEEPRDKGERETNGNLRDSGKVIDVEFTGAHNREARTPLNPLDSPKPAPGPPEPIADDLAARVRELPTEDEIEDEDAAFEQEIEDDLNRRDPIMRALRGRRDREIDEAEAKRQIAAELREEARRRGEPDA